MVNKYGLDAVDGEELDRWARWTDVKFPKGDMLSSKRLIEVRDMQREAKLVRWEIGRKCVREVREKKGKQTKSC